jgi:hypothetical protein
MPPHTTQASVKSWKTCPRCGLMVYKSSRADHDRRCLLVAAHYGSAARMVALFRDSETLTAAALARRAVGVGMHFVTDLLVAGGVSYEEIDARAAVKTPREPHPHCRRCEVALDARGVRPSPDDPTLCAWCAAELAVEDRAGRATCAR